MVECIFKAKTPEDFEREFNEKVEEYNSDILKETWSFKAVNTMVRSAILDMPEEFIENLLQYIDCSDTDLTNPENEWSFMNKMSKTI